MNVPKLRFKEFNDEWVTCTINSVAEVISGGTPDTTNSNYWDGSINWFTPSEVGKSKYISNSKRKITQLGLQKSSAKLLPVGTILLSSRATVGESSILSNNEACTNQGFQSLIPHKNINNEFLYYLIYKYKKSLLKQAFGSTFLEISKNNVEKIKINIPTAMKEQVKLSTFLSLLDKKIELQTKKIEALKLFKSSQICTILNKLEHKNVFLKNLGYFISGNPIGKDKITDKGIPVILYGDLYTKYEEEINDVNQYVKENKKYIKSEKGDLIFPTSTTVDAISLISPSVINISDVVYGGDLIVFKVNKAIVNPKFLSYQINHLKKKEFSKKAQGSTIIHIHADDLLNSTVEIPIMKYQKIISNFGSAINKKIELEKNKLDKLKLLKIGLLQNMFI